MILLILCTAICWYLTRKPEPDDPTCGGRIVRAQRVTAAEHEARTAKYTQELQAALSAMAEERAQYAAGAAKRRRDAFMMYWPKDIEMPKATTEGES